MQTDHPDSERVVPAVAVIADNEWCRVVTCDKLLVNANDCGSAGTKEESVA